MKGLHGWMRILEDSEAAVLSALLKELDQVTASDESSGIQLADVILKDAALTANIIRVANSVTFNPGNVSVTTVSRAVINIGFRNIRSICLSIKVLETVLKDSPSPLLIGMLAKSLHGASQSKSLCEQLNETEREEVFVASLLSHLAELLVLGCKEVEVRELKSELKVFTADDDKNRCAERLLGVSLSRLAKTLMKQWRIEGLVNEVLGDVEEDNPKVAAIKLGNEVSRAALLGWDSQEFKDITAKIAEFKGVSEVEVKNQLLKVADEAADTVSTFGNKALTEQMPSSTKQVSLDDNLNGEEELLRPTLSVELSSYDELSVQLDTGKPDINKVFKIALLGLNKGIGLERVAIAVFEKDLSKVTVKYAAGEGTKEWRKRFSVTYEKSRVGFLYNLFDRDQVAWIGNSSYQHITQYLTPEYYGVTGRKEFFIAPLMSGKRKIGFMYADMGVSARELSSEYLEGFHKFYEVVRETLESLGR